MNDNMMDNPAYTYAIALRDLIDFANIMKRHPGDVMRAAKMALHKGIPKTNKPAGSVIVRGR